VTTHGPISEEYKKQMEAIAKTLDEFLNGGLKGEKRRTGFCVLMFPFGTNEPDRDRINYISNANRKDMITALKELVARFEGHDHVAPTGKQ
jgi:hypothetical protein